MSPILSAQPVHHPEPLVPSHPHCSLPTAGALPPKGLARLPQTQRCCPLAHLRPLLKLHFLSQVSGPIPFNGYPTLARIDSLSLLNCPPLHRILIRLSLL